MSNVEILAPAGDYSSFLAALYAGADAIYMAGKSFGARASASNFTEEEFINALNLAHIHDRKIYLTLNTLIKEREWSELYSFLKPLYEAGLDGVIIQDLGLINYLSTVFPELPLHASTQMTITDASSVKLLKEKGICRVVPARELSLEELKKIKKETGLEIETFVHGALCYGYSGQCLFSSFLGGRSGNRGRCAGPCRLPYTVDGGKKANYPLSLKDLCTIDHIGELIDAGIDSFKIEGRMKSPEYVAGVTTIYRKYVDNYYAGDSTTVSEKDRRTLENLYLRSSIGSGYYYKHNSKDMITISDPSYNNQDKTVVEKIHDEYCDKMLVRAVNASVSIHVGSPIEITLYDDDGNCITHTGDTVDEAGKRPATEDDVRSRLNKTGNTVFIFDSIDIDMDDNCFLPVSLINNLRRDALSKYKEILLAPFKRVAKDNIKISGTIDGTDNKESYTISVTTQKQYRIASKYDVAAINVPYDLIYTDKLSADELKNCNIVLPRILRKRDDKYLESLKAFLINSDCGILVRNLEELEILKEWKISNKLILDHTLYAWNKGSLNFLKEEANELTAPVELSLHELNDLNYRDFNLVIYGYTSLMVSANCIKKTTDACKGNYLVFESSLKDRYDKRENVLINCVHCYNELFNSVPTSYHTKMNDIRKYGYHKFRIDLTCENDKECTRVLDYYLKGAGTPVDDYTLGHLSKGSI